MQTYTDLSQALKEQDKMQVPDLSNQELTEIPVEAGQLTHLTELYLWENQIETIPLKLFNWPVWNFSIYGLTS